MEQSEKKIGLGSLSLLLCVSGIFFNFSFGDKGCFGDIVIKFLGLNAWSSGTNRIHYTVFYSSIFFVTSILLGFKFKDDLGAILGTRISLFISVLLLLCILGLVI